LTLDVTSARSIDSALAEVHRQLDGANLSGLVNNAAVFLLGPLEQTPLDAVEHLFRVNVTGVVAVTQTFLPLLRQAKGRIVNVSSVNGRLSFPFCSFYSASKFALEAISDALRVELAPWGIEVSLVEPGVTRTDIRAEGARAWAERQGRLTPEERALYAAPFAGFQGILPQVDGGAADHHHVADAVYRALTEDPPATRYLAGPDTAQWLQMASLPDRQRDRDFIAMFTQPGEAVPLPE
jgi:NAD(P)-dependent dehydrogenase (short-subunit alcohol dehydrogenase family)